MAEQLAENYHNTWGRKKKLELQAKGPHRYLSNKPLDRGLYCSGLPVAVGVINYSVIIYSVINYSVIL